MASLRTIAGLRATLFAVSIGLCTQMCLSCYSGEPRIGASGPFDILIHNARIVDGAGNPWFRGDVGIVGDRIAAVGRLTGTGADRIVDAAGRVLTPGFFDLMGQSSLILITDPPSAESKLRQGITTYLSGESGAAAPQNEITLNEPVAVEGDSIRWETYPQYFTILERYGIPLNVIHNVGLSQVREVVLGEGDVQPTEGQMEEMKALVRRGMEAGAAGVSTALIYPPATYATTEELIELAEVAADYGGVYFTHLRNESGAVLEAIQEALTVGAAAGVPVHIYHLKAAGQSNWPLMARAIATVDSARAAGMDVTADVYPYIRNGIGLGSFLHPRHYARGDSVFRATLSDPALRSELRREVESTTDWENWYLHVGRDWDNVLIVSAPDSVDQRVIGRSVAGAAEILGTDHWNAFFNLVQVGRVSVNPKSMNEEQKWQALRAPWVMIDTDASPVNPDSSASAHPRAFGAFPRVIAKYVREDGVITLQEAVRRMTSLAANRLGIHDRGIVAPGMAADLLLFDPDKLQDMADFTDPMQFAEGIDFLLVNGTIVIDDGDLLDVRPGRVLKRGGE